MSLTCWSVSQSSGRYGWFPLLPCSNQSAQTAITRGCNCCTILKDGEGGKKKEWLAGTKTKNNSQASAIISWNVHSKALRRGIKYLYLQGSRNGLNSLWMAASFSFSSAFLVLRRRHAAKSATVTYSKCDKRNIIRPTIQHPYNNRETSFVVLVQLNFCYVKLDPNVAECSIKELRGFKWIFSAACMQGNSACSPNRWGQESRAKGRHPRAQRERTRTHQKRKCAVPGGSQRYGCGCFKAVKLLMESSSSINHYQISPILSRSPFPGWPFLHW